MYNIVEIISGNSKSLLNLEGDVFIAIGNNEIRKHIMQTYANRAFISLIYPSATISATATIGKGSIVMANSIINPFAQIWKGVILNSSCVVEHDCIVVDYCHISVNTTLCGTSQKGNQCFIGANATIKNNTTVHDNCMIGMGSVVLRDIKEAGTHVGVPAKRIKWIFFAWLY